MPWTEHLSRLPDELVAAILVRLPPKQVARARLVCRRWRALTTDHHFLRASFLRQHAGHPVAGFFFNSRFWGNDGYYPLDREAEAAADDTEVHLAHDLSFIRGTCPADPGRGSMKVFGSCSGLLLLIYWPPRSRAIYCVCNPLTKKVVPIGLPDEFQGSSVSLVFDPSKSQYYKIVALGDMYSVHVYSSEIGSWRMAIHPDRSARMFQGLCPLCGVYWNGSIVWIVAHSLVRFVIEEEHVTKMPMPRTEKDWICAYVGESAGHLQMIGYTKKEKLTACFDILEMQGDQLEWSVLYRVDLNRVKELYPEIEIPTFDTRYHEHEIVGYLALSPVYVIRGTGNAGQHGLLIFSIPGKIMSYNMEDQEVSMIQEVMSTERVKLTRPFEQFWFDHFAYNPSLFHL